MYKYLYTYIIMHTRARVPPCYPRDRACLASRRPPRDPLTTGTLQELDTSDQPCRGTSLIRNAPLLGPYSGTIPRVRWWPLWKGGCFS